MKIGFKSSSIDKSAKIDTIEKPNTSPKAEDISADDMMNELFDTGWEESVESSDPFGYIGEYMFGPEDDTGFADFVIPDPETLIERFEETFDRSPRLSEIDTFIDKYEYLVYTEIPRLKKEFTDAIESGELSPAEMAVSVKHRSELQKKESDGLRALDKLNGEIKPNKLQMHNAETKAMWDLDGDGTVAEILGFALNNEGQPVYYDLETKAFLDIIPNLAGPVNFARGNVDVVEDPDALFTPESGEPIADLHLQMRDPADTTSYDDSFASNSEFATSWEFTPPDTVYVKMDDNYGPDLKVEEGNGYDPTYVCYPWSVDAEGNISQNLDDVDKTNYVRVQVASVEVKDLYGKRYIELLDKGGQLIMRAAVHGRETTANIAYGEDLGGGLRRIDPSMVGFGCVDEGMLHKKFDFVGITSHTRHILSHDDSALDVGEIAAKYGLTPPENDPSLPPGEYDRRLRAFIENVNLYSGETYSAKIFNVGKAADGNENDGLALMEQTWTYGSDNDVYIEDDPPDVLIYEDDATNNYGMPDGCTFHVTDNGDRAVAPVDTYRTGVFFKGKGLVTGSNYNDFIVMENEHQHENPDYDKFFPEAIDSDSPLNFSYYKSSVGSDFLVSHSGNVGAQGVAFADIKTDPGGSVYLKEASGEQVGVKWNENEEIESMPRNLKTSFTVNSEGGEVNLKLHDEVVSSLDSNGVVGENDKYSHWRPSTYDDNYSVNENAAVFTNMPENDDINSANINVTTNSRLHDEIDTTFTEGWTDLFDTICKIRETDNIDIQQQLDEEGMGTYEAEIDSFLGDIFGEIENEQEDVLTDANEDLGDGVVDGDITEL